MEIQFGIGREEIGANTITVPPTCKKASRHHAKLLWKDGTVTIEDNESANGTFVNGKRIAKTKVGENDIVWLGGNGGAECYQVDMKKVFDTFREKEKKARTDYSKEFEDLKQAYIEYQTEVSAAKKKHNNKQKMLNYIPSVLGMSCLAIPGIPLIIRPIATLAGLGISYLLLSKDKNNDIDETIVNLQIKYQPRYCCPKCGQKYPLTTHWRKLEAEGKCLNPKCDAKFVK